MKSRIATTAAVHCASSALVMRMRPVLPRLVGRWPGPWRMPSGVRRAVFARVIGCAAVPVGRPPAAVAVLLFAPALGRGLGVIEIRQDDARQALANMPLDLHQRLLFCRTDQHE